MSIKIMSWVWDNSPYDGKALLLHLALADFANDEGDCWPSQPTLARKARCTERHVRDCVKQMIADGFLEITVPSDGVSSHRYRLSSGPRKSVPPRKSTTATPELDDRRGGNRPPKNRQEPSKNQEQPSNVVIACPYCKRKMKWGQPHDCSAMNMRMR